MGKTNVTTFASNLIKRAFTLAEVLITLGIIGVVAAMTLPTLVQKQQEKVIVTQLAKNYSILSQAFLRMQADYGPLDSWGIINTNTGEVDEEGNSIYDLSSQRIVAQRLKQHLKVIKSCENGKVCLDKPSYAIDGELLSAKGTIVDESKNDSPAEARFFLNDGTYVALGWVEANGTTSIMVVLPGKKSTLGKTRFYFTYTPRTGLRPEGGPESSGFQTYCNMNHGTNYLRGRHCAAWVIYNQNMDYLRCADKLSWDGAKSCKEAQ